MASAEYYEEELRKEILQKAFEAWEVQPDDEKNLTVHQKPDAEDESLIVAWLELKRKNSKTTLMEGTSAEDSFHALMKLLHRVGVADGCLTGHRVSIREEQSEAAAAKARDRAKILEAELAKSSGDSDKATAATSPGKKSAKGSPKKVSGGSPKKPSGSSGKGGNSGKGSGSGLPIR